MVFIPITLTGTTFDLAQVKVSFKQIVKGNQDLTEIQVPWPVEIDFQKGKIFNLPTAAVAAATVPDIRDGIAGLQYLAGKRGSGLEPTFVNVVNMASTRPADSLVQPAKPDVANIVALMQYLAGLRDSVFQVMEP